MNAQTQRFYLIDAIRGIAIINMVAFHFLFDVNILFGQNLNWYSNPSVYVWQQGICFTYIIIAGLVWRFGAKTHIKRGLFLIVASLIISLITELVVPQEAIWFGILSFLGCALLITSPCEKLLKKVPMVLGLFGNCLLFVFFKNVQTGVLSLGKHIIIPVPSWLYEIKILTPLGFPHAGFQSSDYFPIFPWIFLFFAGYYLCSILLRFESLQKICKVKIPLLTNMGQHSLLLYFLHQPVCYLVCMLLWGN